MTQQLLTKAQIQQVVEDVITSFDTEVSRVMVRNKVTGQSMLETIFRWHYDQPLYTMFTGSCVQHYSNAVFTDNNLRDLFMNISERVSLKWAAQDLCYDDRFVDTFSLAICRTKDFTGDKDMASTIDSSTKETIAANHDIVRKLLNANMWYFVLYILLINLEYSQLFGAVVNKQPKDNAGTK